MGRRTHSGCDPSESWHDRVGHRRKSSRHERNDHLPLRRRRTLRARGRQPAEHGLQKRAFDGRRPQSLEKRWVADEKTEGGNSIAGNHGRRGERPRLQTRIPISDDYVPEPTYSAEYVSNFAVVPTAG